ncbi:LuxR family maltose regulon positive regulatory protein [Sphingomonas zeicaulis]|uniref:LuxR C-terminal-related transcriptional regulator n=1 Tax=Sphingomonas zeicaulis TaxID=1632740 RepID=UPI003D232456
MLIQTKLAPPNRSIDLLWRATLVDRITGTGQHLTVVSAPAGYGKTTLLSQCHAQWRREDVAVAWYSVDESKFEADQFFAYLMAALHRAGLPLPYSQEAIEAGLPGLAAEAAARAIVLALEASEEPVRLIIDDYHRIASQGTNRFLDYVIERMPAHAAIIIALRGLPDIALSSLRVSGQLLQLEQSDLRFSDSEARSFISDQSGKVDWEELIDRTQGWPAALQLLRLWLAGRDQVDTLAHLTRRSSDLADYLAEQVVSGLSPETQQFLLETSIAQRICKGLGDAISGRTDSAQMLDQLRRQNLLVAPLDEEGVWYRFHPLLREFLYDSLAQRGQAMLDALHLRAASWLAGQNLLPEALAHAALVSDAAAALGIIEAAGGWRMAIRGGLALLRHLDDLDPAAAGDFPRVTLGQAYYAAQHGRLLEARALLDGLLAARPIVEVERTDPALACEILCNDLVTHIYEDRSFPPECLPILERQLAHEGHDPTLRVLLHHLLCLDSFDRGDDLWCRVHGEKACKLARLHQLPLLEVYAYQYLGLSQMRTGRRREAELYFRRSLEHATRHFGEGSPQVAVAIALLAYTLYLSGDLSTATDLLESALPVIEATEGWHEVFVAAYATQAWFAMRTGNLAQAEYVIQRGHETSERRNLPRLRYQLELMRVRMLLSLGHSDRAAQLLAGMVAPSATFLRRDRRLSCDHRVALLTCALQCGTVDATLMASLEEDVADAGSIVLEIEMHILRAAAHAAGGRQTEAARSLRLALEAAESEGLIGIVSQFGALLPAILEACEEVLHLFEPAQRTVVARLRQNSPAARKGAIAIPPSASDIIVTPREVDVLRALADGMSSKEMARSLGVAESTIKTHRINIYRKLNVATRSRAISAARNLRLI